MKTIAYIAQVPHMQAPQTPTDLTAWGVIAMGGYLIVKEAISAFRQQNNQESKIIDQLMLQQKESATRLEARHDEVLVEIREILAKTLSTIEQQQTTINRLSELQYNSTRSYAENLMGIRSELKELSAGVKELVRRSDLELGIAAPSSKA